jgi:hypothetical protein
MRANEFITEQLKQMPTDTYEEFEARQLAPIIRKSFNRIYPGHKITIRSTPEGYANVRAGNMTVHIGAGIHEGGIGIYISGGMGAAHKGEFPGAITAMIKDIEQAIIKKYGQPAMPTALSIDHDRGHGVWQHIAQKHGMEYSAHKVDEDWNKVNRHDKTDGLSQKAVNAYRREHPGSKLQTAVTTKPSKLKAGSKDAKRRKSFCARMSGNKGPMKKPNGEPTPKALALRRWNCE